MRRESGRHVTESVDDCARCCGLCMTRVHTVSRVDRWSLSAFVRVGLWPRSMLAKRHFIRCLAIPSIADGRSRKITHAKMDGGCKIPTPSRSGTAGTSSSRPAVLRDFAELNRAGRSSSSTAGRVVSDRTVAGKPLVECCSNRRNGGPW